MEFHTKTLERVVKKTLYLLFGLLFSLFSIEAQESHNTYHERFSDLLLVVHFNFPYYGNIPFLKKLYAPIFEHIVFYGEKEHPDVFAIKTHEGFFLSDVLQDVLTRFPDYKGYLILQDDCVLNFWNCVLLDQNKIWFALKTNTNHNLFSNIITLDGQNISGPFWLGWNRALNGTTRLEATQKAYAQLTLNDLELLNHNIGKNKEADTSLTTREFISRLNAIRIKLQQEQVKDK